MPDAATALHPGVAKPNETNQTMRERIKDSGPDIYLDMDLMGWREQPRGMGH